MNKFLVVLASGFFVFLMWIIYLANSGSDSWFFDFIRHLPYGDKLGHFGLFGTLTLLFNLASRFKIFSCFGFNCYWGTAAVSVFALFEEFSQIFIDSRTFDIQDLLANSVGISLFSWLSYWLSRMIKQRQQLLSDDPSAI